MQGINQLVVDLQRGFASGEYHEACRFPFTDCINDSLGRHFVMQFEISITETALQVASAETDKHCRAARMSAFALQ